MDIKVYKRWDLQHRRILGYTAEYAYIRSKGDNPKDAKEKLAELLPKVVKWIQQDPLIFQSGKYFCVITASYNQGAGYDSRILCPDGHICEVSHPADWDNANPIGDCERSARMHIAQMRYSDGDADAYLTLTSSGDMSEFRSWVQFQERYRVLVDLGYNSNTAHDIACGSPAHAKYEDAIANPPMQANLAGIAR